MRWAPLILSVCSATALSGVVIVAPTGSGGAPIGGIQFVQNASFDYDYAEHTGIPDGFGDGEFTLEVYIEPSQVGTIGQTQTLPGIVENWADETAEPYTSAEWWYDGNFLLDGHNNNDFDSGTFSLQVYNAGYVRWTFGDGAAADARVGDLHGIQNSSGINILDGSPHTIALVRRWSGASDADLELWIDGVLQDSETTTSRTDMAATWWDQWGGFPSNQEGWFWGAEKQAALGSIDYADYKGLVRYIAFHNEPKDAGEFAGPNDPVDTVFSGYLDHWPMDEGTGSTATSANGLPMNLVNPGDFWL